MYEKKLDRVVKAPSVFDIIEARKRSSSFSAFMNSIGKYIVYLLGIILILSLVSLIAMKIVLSPVEGFSSKALALNSASIVPEENSLNGTTAIFPKTEVYYHGVRIGEYSGDDVAVSGVLSQFNITLGENDVINHKLDDNLFYGMTIRVDEIYYKEKIVETVIPFEIIEIESQTVPKGTRVVETEGVMGSSQKVVNVKYVNGEIAEESEASDRYVAPINEIVYVGVGGVFTAPDGKKYNYSYYLDVTATAYTHTGDPTYMGTVAEVGVIAVDPRNIKLGSDVYVIGGYGDYGLCRAEDIGGGIKGLRIDVFLDTEEECVRFGRRKMRAYVME